LKPLDLMPDIIELIEDSLVPASGKKHAGNG
jgi:hypothetical protein